MQDGAPAQMSNITISECELTETLGVFRCEANPNDVADGDPTKIRSITSICLHLKLVSVTGSHKSVIILTKNQRTKLLRNPNSLKELKEKPPHIKHSTETKKIF
jgi:hypothetical protein